MNDDEAQPRAVPFSKLNAAVFAIHTEERILNEIFNSQNMFPTGADPSGKDAAEILSLAFKAQYWQIVRTLVDLGTPLRQVAAQFTSSDDVTMLSHVAHFAGGSLDSVSFIPSSVSMRPRLLSSAARQPSQRAFHLLFAHGGLPSERPGALFSVHSLGFGLLIDAVVGGDPTILATVLDAVAAAEPSRSRRELLEMMPPDTVSADEASETLLYSAVSKGRPVAVEMIMSHVSGDHMRQVLEARTWSRETAIELTCYDSHVGMNETDTAAAVRAILSAAAPARVPALLLARGERNRRPLVERCGVLSNPLMLRLFVDTVREAATAVDAAAGGHDEERAKTAAELSNAAWCALARHLGYPASFAQITRGACTPSAHKCAETLRLLVEIIATDSPGLAGLAERPPRVEPAAAHAAAPRLAAEWRSIYTAFPDIRPNGPKPPRTDEKNPALAVATHIISMLPETAAVHPQAAAAALALALALAPPHASDTPAEVNAKWQRTAMALAMRTPSVHGAAEALMPAEELVQMLGGVLPPLLVPGAAVLLCCVPAGLCPVCWLPQSPACEPLCAGLRTLNDATDALLLRRLLAAAGRDGASELQRGMLTTLLMMTDEKPLTLAVLVEAGSGTAESTDYPVWKEVRRDSAAGPARVAAVRTMLLRAQAATATRAPDVLAETDPCANMATIRQRAAWTPLNVTRFLVACVPVRAVAAAAVARGAVLPLSSTLVSALCAGDASVPAAEAEGRARACFDLLTATAAEELASAPNPDEQMAWLLGHGETSPCGDAGTPLALAAGAATARADAWEPVVLLLRAGAPYHCHGVETILHKFLSVSAPVWTSKYAGVARPLRAVLEAVRDAEGRREALALAWHRAGLRTYE